MLVAALVIGLLTAYYFGVKIGGVAAGVSLFLFLIAGTVPGAALPVYGVVAVGLVGICLIGPKMTRPDETRKVLGWSRRALSRLLRRL